ncbi:histone H3.3-like [Trichogramma pretiosum]|uniref:histone H3.3-like n=1 Tax=Trichogramma pretiosum TaxID=7493 RepID=UPI0006C94B1C|nr:histone H3.3-like [Trichogramma pretiosum]
MVRRKGNSARNNKRKDSETITDKRTSNKARRNRMIEEIKYLQKSTHLLLPKAPFSRIVREIINDLFPRTLQIRIQDKALQALQEACEMYIVQFFEDAVLLCLHNKRVTLMRSDMQLLRRLRGRGDVINK